MAWGLEKEIRPLGAKLITFYEGRSCLRLVFCIKESVTYIVFGWVDFRGDGKYRRENLSFSLFGNERKMGGVEN